MGHNPFGTPLSPKLFTLQFATVEKISYEITTNIVGGSPPYKELNLSGELYLRRAALGRLRVIALDCT